MKFQLSKTGLILGILLFLFNAFDGIVTCIFLNIKIAEELNPIVRFLYNNFSSWFLIPKILFILLPSLIIAYTYKWRKSLKITAIGVVIFYGLLTIYHIWGIIYVTFSGRF